MTFSHDSTIKRVAEGGGGGVEVLIMHYADKAEFFYQITYHGVHVDTMFSLCSGSLLAEPSSRAE